MTRSSTVLIGLVSTTLALTGCASSASPSGKATPTMTSTYPTPDESRAATLELFEATRALIGGTDWVIDREGFGLCTLPDGDEGAEYIRQDGIWATIDAAAVAEQIARLWESRGFDGVTVEPSRGRLPGFDVTYPMDERRVYLDVGITDFSATVHMSGGCIPGDNQDLTNALVE